MRPRLLLHTFLTALLGAEAMVFLLRLISRKIKVKNYPINMEF